MGQNHLGRKRLRTLYHWRYQRHKSLDEGICVYCGDVATVEDHCPALAVVDALSIEGLEDAGIPLLLVPACVQCNCWLGAKPLLTIGERCHHIAERWERVLKRYGNARWTRAELDELGPVLRSAVEAQAIAAEFARRRRAHAKHARLW